MRTGGEDALEVVLTEVFDVFLRGRLVEILFTRAAGEFAVAALFLHDGEFDARSAENLHHAARDLARAAVVTRGAADPVENVVVFARLRHGDVEPVRPFESVIGIEPPGIADRRHVFEGVGKPFGEVALFEREMTAKTHEEFRDRNVRGAGARAGAAGRAAPDDVLLDRFARKRRVRGIRRGAAHGGDEVAGRQRRARAQGRTHVVAAAAFGAAVQSKALGFGEVRRMDETEGFLLFNVVDLRERSRGRRLAAIDGGGRAVEVGVEGERNRRDEGERQETVEGPEPHVHAAKRIGREARGDKELRNERPHRGEMHPGGLFDGEAQAFDDKARQHDDRKRHVGDEELDVALCLALLAVAAPGADEKREKNGDARHVEDELVGEVHGPLQELRADDVVADVPVERRKGGAEKEEEESDGEHRVESSARRFKILRLIEDALKHPDEALFHGRLGDGCAVQTPVADNAPDQNGDGGDPYEVDADLPPEGDVPKAGTNRKFCGHKRESENSTLRVPEERGVSVRERNREIRRVRGATWRRPSRCRRRAWVLRR